MYASKDRLFRVEVASNLSQVVFPTADFSIVNLPSSPESAKSLFTHLYNTPVERHLTLVVSRQKKDERLGALGNLASVDGFKYFDSVYLWYDKASGASNTTFTPLCEAAWLFFKGDLPDVKRTKWFSEEQSNATNHWALSANEYDIKPHTYYQKFSHELGLILYSLTRPGPTRRFIYGCEANDENLFAFCYNYSIGVYTYCATAKEARLSVENYEAYVASQKSIDGYSRRNP